MFTSVFNRFAVAASFAFSVFAASAAPVQNLPIGSDCDDQLVTLHAGTAVSLTLNETFTPDDVSVGNSIDFMVRGDVTVNGKVLIAAGSIAEGWVKSVKTSCDGACSEVTITVETVQAVDGQRVNLRSVPCVIKAPCCGKGGQKPAQIGQNLSARVLNDVKIDA